MERNIVGERAGEAVRGKKRKRGKRKREKEIGMREGMGFGTEMETDST